MKKLALSIILTIKTLACFASSSTTTTQQISGTAIQFNCISSLDTIILGVPTTINITTMDLTNACNALTDAAQAYEDAADAASNFHVQADYYYNAAQAYAKACNLIINTTTNIGAIGDAQDITYIQSYRCSALQAFNQSFESYLTLYLQNSNTPQAQSIAANAVLALSDVLTTISGLITEQINIIATLQQTKFNASNETLNCSPTRWYPIQLPNENYINCQYARITLPEDFSIYTKTSQAIENATLSSNSIINTFPIDNIYSLRSIFGFPAPNPDSATWGGVQGTPGQYALFEFAGWDPLHQSAQSHDLGLLSNTNSNETLGSYISNLTIGSSSSPLYDQDGLGRCLLSYAQIQDPYSIHDPRANSTNPSYDANFAQIVQIIPQPQYIFTTPAPTTVQNLHDAIRDYMYSADINKMDSYLYNCYSTVTALHTQPDDLLPAIRRMCQARMNVVESYEGAMIKIVTGLTGKTSLSPAAWSNESTNLQGEVASALYCIQIILPMYIAIIQQITNYDVNILNKLHNIVTSTQSSNSGQSTSNVTQESSAAQSAQDAAAQDIQKAQSAYQQAQTNQTSNVQAAANQALQDQANTQAAQVQAQANAAIAEQVLTAQQAATTAQTTAEEIAKQIPHMLQTAAQIGAGVSQSAQTAGCILQAQTYVGQAQAAAAQAQTAYQQAQAAAAKNDLQTATAQAALATTAQQATNSATQNAINQAQQAQTSAAQDAKTAAAIEAQAIAQENALQAATQKTTAAIIAQEIQARVGTANTYSTQAQAYINQAQASATLIGEEITKAGTVAAQIAPILAQQTFSSKPTPTQAAADAANMANIEIQGNQATANSQIQQMQTYYAQIQQAVAQAQQAQDINTANAAITAIESLLNKISPLAQDITMNQQNTVKGLTTVITQSQIALAAQPAATQQASSQSLSQPSSNQSATQIAAQKQLLYEQQQHQKTIAAATQPPITLQLNTPTINLSPSSTPPATPTAQKAKAATPSDPAPVKAKNDSKKTGAPQKNSSEKKQPEVQNMIAKLFEAYEKNHTNLNL